jgi:DNA-binding MarR family transcriptional regulator
MNKMQDATGAADAAALREWMEASTARSMRDFWHYAKKSGLSMPQFGLLRRLYHGGECEVHDVGKHFDVSSAAASQLVDRLVQAGLVERTENPDDRRARRVALSARGRVVMEQGIEESYRWVDELIAGVGSSGRAVVRQALAELTAAEAALPRQAVPVTRGAIRDARGRR